MTPSSFYTSSPSDWIAVLQFVRTLSGGTSQGRAHRVSPYPNRTEGSALHGTIYDPAIFGTEADPQGGWGHIRVRNVVHPACIEKIAELLGLEPLQVRHIAWWQGTIWPDGRYASRPYMTGLRSGPAFLRQQLERVPADPQLEALGFTATDLVLDMLPVPPRHFRPAVPAPGHLFRAGSDDMIYNALVLQAGIIDFFWENQGSESAALGLLFEEQSVLPLQRLLEQLVHTYEVGRDQSRWTLEASWRERMPPGEQSAPGIDDDEPEFPDFALPDMLPRELEEGEVRQWIDRVKVPVQLLVLNNTHLLIQYLDRTELRAWPSGETVLQWETRGHLLGLDPSEKFLVYQHLGHLLVREMATGKWLEGLPSSEFIFADAFDQETAYLVSLKRQETIRLLELTDAPTAIVRSRNGKYIWLEDKDANGGIYGTESGWLLAEPGFLELRKDPPFLSPDGKVMVLSSGAMEIMEEALAESAQAYDALDLHEEVQQSAFALRGDRWWIFAFNILWLDAEPVWRTDMPITAAAFDPTHQYLFLGNREEIRILKLDDQGHPIALERLSLAPTSP